MVCPYLFYLFLFVPICSLFVHVSFLYHLDGQNFRGVIEDEAGRVVAKLWDASRDVALSQGVAPVEPEGGSGSVSIAPAPAEVSTSVKPLEHPEGDSTLDLRAYGADPSAEGIPQDGMIATT